MKGEDSSALFNLGTRKGEWSASRFGRSTPEENIGWLGFRAVLGLWEKKYLFPRPRFKPRSFHPVA
jgi:hypothetical protein